MPANKMTLKAVEAILQADLGVTTTVRNNVLRDLGQEAETQCGEQAAARLLDIGPSTLYNWRNDKWPCAPHPFWFHTWQTPTGETRYDIAQLRAYTALRKAICTRENPQPNITEADVNRFMAVMGEH